MLDCWMAFDVEFAVRLAERLRPYRLKWIEDCLIPEDHASHKALRERLPWQTLTDRRALVHALYVLRGGAATASSTSSSPTSTGSAASPPASGSPHIAEAAGSR